MTKYTHLELNRDVEAIAGYYTPQKEVRLNYRGREVLYVVGQLVMESSCCGSGDCFYALVPGYITGWQTETNQDGLPVSEIEPIADRAAQDNIRKFIQEAEHVARIDFWQG